MEKKGSLLLGLWEAGLKDPGLPVPYLWQWQEGSRVSRLINSRCTGAKGNGSALIDVYSTQRIPAIFPDNKNWMEFLIFRYTFLPFATALIIVAKLSSVKIMAAASLETSVPAFPIAIPMSAFFKAGASFTPSPVIAVMCLFSAMLPQCGSYVPETPGI